MGNSQSISLITYGLDDTTTVVLSSVGSYTFWYLAMPSSLVASELSGISSGGNSSSRVRGVRRLSPARGASDTHLPCEFLRKCVVGYLPHRISTPYFCWRAYRLPPFCIPVTSAIGGCGTVRCDVLGEIPAPYR